MKKILLTIVLIFGVIFVLNSGAEALPFPDPDNHPPLGPDDIPGIVEGSSMVSNMFTVPTGGTDITFAYNFVTAEYQLEYPEPDVNDYFGVALLDAYTHDTLFLVSIADVYTSTFTAISGGTNGPHGSYFDSQTGVLPGVFNISATYEGIDAMLAFGVFDVEDSDVDSGVLIDNVSSPVSNGNFDTLIGTGGFIGQSGEYDMYNGNVHLLTVGDGSLAGVSTTDFSDNFAYMSTGPEDMPPLTVVPEPISSALFLIGGATMGFRRFRNSA